MQVKRIEMKKGMRIQLLTCLIAAFTSSCGTQNEVEAETDVHEQFTEVTPIHPGTYSGILPCADCQGILTTVELRKNGIAVVSSVYLGKDETPYILFGLVEYYDTLAIIQGGKDLNMKFKGFDKSILILDEQGNTIDSDLNYILDTSSEKIDLSKPFNANVKYFYMADAHIISLGSEIYPVLMNDLNFEVEKMFIQLPNELRDNYYITAKLRIVEALNMEDERKPHVEILELR